MGRSAHRHQRRSGARGYFDGILNEPAPEKLRQRAEKFSKENLFIALQFSALALLEWQKRYELASKEASAAASESMLSITEQHMKEAGIQSRPGQLQLLGVAAAKTADASELRRGLIQVIEEMQQLRSWTEIFEQLVGKKVIVDSTGQWLRTAEAARRKEEFLGVESIESLAPC